MTQATVTPVFRMEKGDVLHVKVGGEIHISANPDSYIPTREDLDEMKVAWEKVLPAGVNVIVTNHLVNAEIVRVTDGK